VLTAAVPCCVVAPAQRARALAKLRIDFEHLLNGRLSVLAASGDGEAAEWSNEALQAIWCALRALRALSG
jgi:hypothetical protein